MREITSHHVRDANDPVRLFVLDEPGHGGACHRFETKVAIANNATQDGAVLNFQDGPVADVGVNGNVTNEVLLAIVEDRLLAFQAGKYACDENDKALRGVQSALGWLQLRTHDRMSRGVEGTSAV
jgi:hypothetical protein